jgi:serine/threonine-protein kinase
MPPLTFGRYRVDGELGRGGMGVVYRAHDPELDREVAVKHIQLPPDASREARDELEKRFRREAKAAARIRHAGVVAIHDVGATESGLYLVMELIAGESLAHRLERGAFPDRAAALEVAARAADALAAAHRAGVVHRDVKPANILIAADGRVMLTDFGVARSLDDVSELTRTGMVVGSPAYMAPEQLRGAPVDGRADLFSLGVVLYEMLLRKRPFPAQSITTLLYQILHEDPFADPANARELDPATADVLRRLLSKQPEERLPDAASTAAALRQLALTPPSSDFAPTVPHFRPPAMAPPPPTPIPAPVPVPVPLMTPPAPQAYVPPTPPAGTASHNGARRITVFLLVGGGALAMVVAVAAGVTIWNLAPRLPVVQQPQAAAPWTPGSGPPLPEGSLPTAVPAETPLPLIAAATLAPTPGPAPTSSNPFSKPADDQGFPVAPRPTEPPHATFAPPQVTYAPPPTEPPPPPPRREEPSISLKCRRGVELDVDPSEAEVYLDGRRIGTADEVEYRKLLPGHHLIRLVYPGYKPVLAEIEVSSEADEKDVDLEVEMEELEE